MAGMRLLSAPCSCSGRQDVPCPAVQNALARQAVQWNTRTAHSRTRRRDARCSRLRASAAAAAVFDDLEVSIDGDLAALQEEGGAVFDVRPTLPKAVVRTRQAQRTSGRACLLHRRLALCRATATMRKPQLLSQMVSLQLTAHCMVFAAPRRTVTCDTSPASAEPALVTYPAGRAGAVLVDRSRWGRIRVSGDDRLRFLHGQSTADFLSLAPGQGTDTVGPRLPPGPLTAARPRRAAQHPPGLGPCGSAGGAPDRHECSRGFRPKLASGMAQAQRRAQARLRAVAAAARAGAAASAARDGGRRRRSS